MYILILCLIIKSPKCAGKVLPCILFKLQKKMTEKINARPLLLNEVLLDTAGKSEEKVLEEAIGLIEQTESLVDYTYEMSEKELFYSWVKSNHLN